MAFRLAADLKFAQRSADLFWIFVGGLSALTAIAFSGYSTDFDAVEKRSEDYLFEVRELTDTLMYFLQVDCVPDSAFAINPIKNDIMLQCDRVLGALTAFYDMDAHERITGFLGRDAPGAGDCTGLPWPLSTEECKEYGKAVVRVSRHKERWDENRTMGWPGQGKPNDMTNFDKSSELQLKNIAETSPLIAQRIRTLIKESEQIWQVGEALREDIAAVEKSALLAKVRAVSLWILAFTLPFRLMKSLCDFPVLERTLRGSKELKCGDG